MLEAKKEKKMKISNALASEMGVALDQGDDHSSQTSSKTKSEGNPSQHEAPVGLGAFSTKLQDSKVTGFKCDPFPQQGNFRPYFSALCFMVSSLPGNPKKAFALMKAIETSTFEEFAQEEGMGVLWQKLRYELQKTIQGQLLRELLHKDEVVAKSSPPVTANGRQLAWMIRRKFDVDLTEQNISTEREVRDLVFQKDNAQHFC